MAIKNLSSLEINTIVSYQFFSKLKFKGTDEQNRHVLLEDSNGDTKKVYVELFEKYGIKH